MRVHDLVKWRKANDNKSQGELAKLVGTNQSIISRIEAWQTVPDINLAMKLAEKTGIDIRRFVVKK